jgi:glycosyltransferase involved in cell wall biosynthesis
LRRRARASTMILSSTPDTVAIFARLGVATRLMPTIGLETDAWPKITRQIRRGPLRCLFVGNIITLKGVDLALDALARAKTNATFTLIGAGSYTRSAQRRAKKLGIADRVNFRGRLARPEVIALLPEFDVFVLPSLHDTGSFALIEAMLQEMPGICLDCGGPAVALTGECGIKVPLGSRAEVVRGLAAGIENYDANRELLLAHGRVARQRIEDHYNWARKGEVMNEVYLQTWRHWQTPPG